MPQRPEFPLRIYYDGGCSVCAAEIEHYGRQDRAGRLELIDISDPLFDPTPLGIPLVEFMYQIHAMDRRGRVYRGVDAFWAVWQAFPASTLYGLLGTLIMLPGVKPLTRLCYRGFARIRKYLPKRDNGCTAGSCRIDGRRPG